jgi:hypothetical protein
LLDVGIGLRHQISLLLERERVIDAHRAPSRVLTYLPPDLAGIRDHHVRGIAGELIEDDVVIAILDNLGERSLFSLSNLGVSVRNACAWGGLSGWSLIVGARQRLWPDRFFSRRDSLPGLCGALGVAARKAHNPRDSHTDVQVDRQDQDNCKCRIIQ